MKHRISLCISALCFFTAFLITMSSRTAGEEALAARIAPEILRFHILAESNAAHDQELKIGLKGLVLDYVHSQVPDSAGKDGLIEWLENNGDMVFPCGTYDAVRITIGQGKGHNWWCVLYPSLCYTDSLNAVVPESSKQTLSCLLDQDDYGALLPRREKDGKKPEVHVRFRLLDLLRQADT